MRNLRQLGHWIPRVTSYSTQTHPISSHTLYRRLQGCYDPSISINSVLDQWVVDGRSLDHKELISVVRSFRKNRRFGHALEIVEWMSSMKNFNITPGYAAIRLDLISKVHSADQAESYFNSLDKNVQTLPVYGALLNCYTNAKSVDKAEAVLEQIRKSGSPTTLICNRMLSLYSQMGEYEKLDSLLREMEVTGIPFDEFSYNIRLNVYATSSDITQMEKHLMKMETDPFVTVSFCTYTTVAKGYIKIGALQKASAALKKAEHLITPQNIISDCEVLINIYTTLKRKEDVHRIWNLLKRDRKVKLHGRIYRIIITSLDKLDDLDGMRKVYNEWEGKYGSCDIPIANIVFSAYCKRGCVADSESILNRVIESGREPSSSMWSCMAVGYCENGMMEKAVNAIRKSFCVPECKLDLSTLAACFEHLKKKGGENEIEEMLKLLEESGKFKLGFREKMEGYLWNGKPISEKLEVEDLVNLELSMHWVWFNPIDVMFFVTGMAIWILCSQNFHLFYVTILYTQNF